MTSTAIVGGGAAGLSLALMLRGDVSVFEQGEVAGGLCRSVRRDGWTWDIGPHILGGIPRAVDWIVNTSGVEFLTGWTRNRAFIDGVWAAHPFEREQDVDRYMVKMWKTDQLRPQGLGAQPGRRPGGTAMFRYPRHGGYQAITDAWAEQVGERLFLGSKMTLPELRSEYDRVVWTGPRPDGHYNTLVTVTTCCYGPRPEWTAVYLPGDETPFHRLSCSTSFSPFNAPPDGFVVQAEASYATDEWIGYWPHLLDELLYEIGVSEIGERFLARTPFAYPVPVVDLPREREGVIFHGRTGAHTYKNLDGVIADSMALAARLN